MPARPISGPRPVGNPSCNDVKRILMPLLAAAPEEQSEGEPERETWHEWDTEFASFCVQIRSLCREDGLASAIELYYVENWNDGVIAVWATKDQYMLYNGGKDTGTEMSLNIDSIAGFLETEGVTIEQLINGVTVNARLRSSLRVMVQHNADYEKETVI
jgi:hypothetical protein